MAQTWYSVIEEYPGYLISDNGEVQSTERKVKSNRGMRTQKSRILKQELRKGYLAVRLYSNSKGKLFSVHRLVALHFVNGYEEGLVVNHKDGNKLNNHHSNLEWCTITENNRHAVYTGLHKSPSGSNHYSCNHDSEILDTIYDRVNKIVRVNGRCPDGSLASIARDLNVRNYLVHKIAAGKLSYKPLINL